MFEFEYLRNKREGTFANLSKLINKFVISLKQNEISDISDPTIILGNVDLKDKYGSLLSKVNDYLVTYKEIQ
jgi:hypothetical protein